ncbi:hypothetical protein PM082_021674 [Marasmius tenuissimus]|nr:hypothetical protein PM082_021674 [Marasmius tenuissimus]
MAGVSRDFWYPLLEALSFWVVFARENNLPGIPHGLDVYAWLSFVFMQKNICQVCKKSYSDPIFILNCRLCFTCLKLLTQPCRYFNTHYHTLPEECLKAVRVCTENGDMRYIKQDMMSLLIQLPTGCLKDNALLRAYQDRMLATTRVKTYHDETLIGRFAHRGIRVSDHALTVLEGDTYGYDRVRPLDREEWEGFVSRDLPVLIIDLSTSTRVIDSRRTSIVNTNFFTAWLLVLRERLPTVGRYLFNINALALLPSVRDPLLLTDMFFLSPHDLHSRLTKSERLIIDWVFTVDDELLLQLASLDIHPAAKGYVDVEDMDQFLRRRPPVDIAESPRKYSLPPTAYYDGISLTRPRNIWATDEAFVEVKCSSCSSIFSTASAAIRHLNASSRCLWEYEAKPKCLSVQSSLASVALVTLSGHSLSDTRADVMDREWKTFVCVRCEADRTGPIFLGSWRECVSGLSIYSSSTDSPST